MLAFLRTARPLAAAAAVSVFLAACGDDDPSGPAFTEETANQMAGAAEEVIAPIESTVTIQTNLSNVMFALVGGGGGALSAMQPFAGVASLREPLAAARAMSAPLAAARALPAPSAPTGVLIPAEWEGTTFVWSLEQEMYVPSELVGAPANGVRFLYYAVDPFGMPAAPLNDLGHIDLIDESTDATARLEIVAIQDQGDVTLASYFVEGGVTGNLVSSTVTIDSEGYLSDGSDRLDFDMQLVATESGETFTDRFTAELEANGGSISLTTEETLVGEDEIDAEATFTIEGEGNEATIEYAATGTVDESTIDGALTFNGREVVLISGDAFDPEFTRPDGSALTADEIDALARMWIAAGVTTWFVFQTLFPFLLLLAFASF